MVLFVLNSILIIFLFFKFVVSDGLKCLRKVFFYLDMLDVLKDKFFVFLFIFGIV